MTYDSKSHPADEKYSLKGAWSGSSDPFWNFTPHVKSPQRLKLQFKFVHGSTMRSLSVVMSGRSQGHVSNFYIVDLEYFATASRRYTGDRPIHNSTLVGVHMFITHRPTLSLQLHNFDLFWTCRTSSFCTVAWQLARFQLTRRIARSLGDS